MPRSLKKQSQNKKFTTQRQFEAMVQFMAKNKDFARGFKVNLHEKQALWNTLRDQINSLGPPERNSRSWSTVLWVFYNFVHLKKYIFRYGHLVNTPSKGKC